MASLRRRDRQKGAVWKMINLNRIEEVKAIKSNMHAVFGSPQGKEVMKFIEDIGGWTPTIFDSEETNAIIARDANRKLIGTLKTILELSPEQLQALAQQNEGG